MQPDAAARADTRPLGILPHARVAADMVGQLVVGVATRCRTEPGDL
jgi:hypothetical protein